MGEKVPTLSLSLLLLVTSRAVPSQTPGTLVTVSSRASGACGKVLLLAIL